ncbi:uncharacterized protein N0V96_002382 [Colletotrichum fioriniae]|uniref:uncharacterized protein n=1 Tax=Colletotrichum fioriniae TaxID=710243 RepID=UPI0032DBE626|nr:hypothetical protein N0V96_002382 [Colletotrichum fioriniae]
MGGLVAYASSDEDDEVEDVKISPQEETNPNPQPRHTLPPAPSSATSPCPPSPTSTYPSPPGSPPPALSAKFTQFLDLKKKGVHFNAKLAQSAALRNPSLTDKLMSFVDLDGRAGYATTLPPALGWDPTSEDLLPEWASRTALRQSQDKVRGAGARKGGGPVEFVPAAAAGAESAASPAAGIEQGVLVSRGGKRKAGAL